VISIAVSVVALLLAFMILYGFQDKIREKVFNLSGHLTVDKYALSGSFEDVTITVTDSLLNGLRAHPKIRHVQPYAYKAGLLKTDQEVQGVVLKGVDASFDLKSFGSQMEQGTFPRVGTAEYSTEVAVSRRIADLLKLQVGDQVTMYFVQDPPRFRRITITGIYSTGLEEFDERILFGDIGLVRRLNNWDDTQAAGLEVMLHRESDIDAMEDELFYSLNFDLKAISSYHQHPQIFDWLLLLERNVLIFLVLIMVVAAFGMISMVLILIMERTRMIGLLKALGATDRQLRSIFMHSALRLIAIGLLAGNSLGLLLCWLQYQFRIIPLDPSNYYMHHVPVLFHWPTVLGINVLVMSVVGLTLLIPLTVISGIRPIQAIRFD
jgi:lipoprotein-releasing system permease protein